MSGNVRRFVAWLYPTDFRNGFVQGFALGLYAGGIVIALLLAIFKWLGL